MKPSIERLQIDRLSVKYLLKVECKIPSEFTHNTIEISFLQNATIVTAIISRSADSFTQTGPHKFSHGLET